MTARRFKGSDYLAMLGELAPELGGAEPGALRAARLPHLRCVIAIGADAPAGMIAFDRAMRMGGDIAALDLENRAQDLSDRA